MLKVFNGGEVHRGMVTAGPEAVALGDTGLPLDVLLDEDLFPCRLAGHRSPPGHPSLMTELSGPGS